MADVNNVVLIGRLTRDPELKTTPSGVAVANVGIAVGRPFKNAAGERETDFFELVLWRQAAEFASTYLAKGNRVSVVGRAQARKYTDKNGAERKVFEIMVNEISGLETRPKEGNETPAAGGDAHSETYDPFGDE